MNRKPVHGPVDSSHRIGVDLAQRALRRRLILAAAAGSALAWTGVTFGQAKKQPVQVGWLHPGARSQAGNLSAFREGMAAFGWTENSNYVIEERWAEGQEDRLAALALELAEKRPAVIVAALSNAVKAAAQAAPTTPVVQANGSDPVAQGLARSLARPGGKVTGVVNVATEVSAKRLELLLETAPEMKRVGFLVDSNLPAAVRAANVATARRAVAQYAVEARFAEVMKPEDFDTEISRLASEDLQGLVALPAGGLFIAERRRIVKLALAQGWPLIGGPGWARDGALLQYNADTPALYRRAAYYVDRILKGAQPGDLPIEQPTNFVLVVNMKTAKALGITIPQSILVRATRLIE